MQTQIKHYLYQISTHLYKRAIFLVLLYPFLLLIFIQTAYGQTFNVQGNVTTMLNDITVPVRYALVTFTDQNEPSKTFSTITDSSGKYELSIVTKVELQTPLMPQSIELAQNYPNPFSSTTAISYQINKQSDVSIKIYDILGREVKGFKIGVQTFGTHGIVWDGKDNFGNKLASGIYFYQLRTGKETITKKMLFGLGGTNIRPTVLQTALLQKKDLSKGLLAEKKENKSWRYGIASGTFTVQITNTDSTTPRIEMLKYNNIIIAGDTVLNFQATAASGDWKPLGLQGKLVSELKLHKNYLYACAGRDGLYRLNLCSENSQWVYLGFADSTPIRELDYGVRTLLEIETRNEILVGIGSQPESLPIGIFRSSDFGVSWMPSDSGIRFDTYPRSSEIASLAISPHFPNVLFAGLSSTIYKSINYGLYWKRVYNFREAGGLGINAIRFSHKNINEVWAGGESSRFAPYLLHSTDTGNTWTLPIRFPPNLGPYTFDNAVYDIAIDPRNDSVLYFGMLGVIAKTTDKAQTFQRVLGWEDGIYRNWRLEMNPENPDELFATGFYLYRTKDGGMTWQRINPPFFEIYALAVDWKRRVLYVSVSSPENGIYKMHF